MKHGLLLVPVVLLWGCLPDMDSPAMRQNLLEARRMMAVDQVDRTIGRIELYRLRHGIYPASLDSLDTLARTFMTADKGMLHYARLDTGYRLDLVHDVFPQLGQHHDTLVFTLPAAYWQGLGCRRSNLME